MLPKIEHPIILIYVLSLDRKVKFRPFLVKEEKILLIAKESKDPEEIRLAVRQVIQNCLLEDINVDALPIFDIEMIFVKLRAKSVGETVKLEFNCRNIVDDAPCNTTTDYTVDLEKIAYDIPENHNNTVMITDKVGVKLKYPTIGVNLDDEDDDAYMKLISALYDSIECIFDENGVYKLEDASKEELAEFMENFTIEKMAKVEEFFKTSPKVVLEDTINCPKCGYEHKIRSEELIDFFT